MVKHSGLWTRRREFESLPGYQNCYVLTITRSGSVNSSGLEQVLERSVNQRDLLRMWPALACFHSAVMKFIPVEKTRMSYRPNNFVPLDAWLFICSLPLSGSWCFEPPYNIITCPYRKVPIVRKRNLNTHRFSRMAYSVSVIVAIDFPRIWFIILRKLLRTHRQGLDVAPQAL